MIVQFLIYTGQVPGGMLIILPMRGQMNVRLTFPSTAVHVISLYRQVQRQHIDITYDSLSLLKLGLADTNVLTVKDSDNAINEIKAALETISDQRATFGAYQNRLEHARKINENSEENTQYAESVIRDADIADEMMEYSINSILSQAGTSMLTQANQQLSTVLQLLQ